MFERFSEQAHRVVAVGEAEARRLGHGHLGTEHLLLGLLADSDSPAARALHDHGATLEACREKALEAVGPDGAEVLGGDARAELPFTDRARRALERASRLALRRRETLVQPGHVLLSVLDVEGTAGQVLRRLNVDLDGVRRELEAPPEPTAGPAPDPPPPAGVVPRCAQCGGALDVTLTHRMVRSTGETGPGRDLLVAYCGECGSAVGITTTRSGGRS